MRQPLGQHFLKNTGVITQIIDALDLRTGETVVEIGPGEGALTFPLAERCAKFDCKLIAIEKDEALVKKLRNWKIKKLIGDVTIMHGDALEEIPKLFTSWQIHRGSLPAGRHGQIEPQMTDIKIVGNIPYYITGKLLRTISELEHKPKCTVLMVQREVAERIVTKPPHMNLLAAATQIWADAEIIALLKQKDFDPPPEVESAVVRLLSAKRLAPCLPAGRLSADKLAHYYSFIHVAFKQPRKTLLNNLCGGFDISKSQIIDTLKGSGWNEKTRGQELGIAQLLNLTNKFFN